MTNERLSDLPRFSWMESRIPAVDALAAFVPDGSKPDPVVTEMQERIGSSRWFPVEGGHRVLMPYEGGEYDSSRFTVERDAWDHEHCGACGERIPPMTLCHVTEPEQPYILLCATCFEQHVASKQK
jgi:hypothetical protein